MGLIDDIKTGVGASFCSAFNTYDRANRLLAGILYPDRVDDVLPRSPAGQIAAGGIALFCDRPPIEQPAGFLSGRCSDNYCVYVRIIGTVASSGAPYDTGPNTVGGGFCGFPGPISPPFIAPGGGGFPNVFVTAANGQSQAVGNVSGINVEQLIPDHYRQNGLPDNCDAPGFEPIPDPENNAPLTINNNTGTINFLAPVFLVNGTVNVPFNFEVGELNFSGTLELNTGEINLNFGGQPIEPDYPVVPTPDGEPPDADLDDPEDEKKANIIGVIVVSTEIGTNSATEVPKKFMPDVYVPRIADVSFQIRIKNKSHWTSDLPVKSKNAYIACPGEIDAIDVVVEPQPGWQVSVTPVRGIVPSNQVELL